jgi:hypothetical protein
MAYQIMMSNSVQLITLFQQLRVLSKHRTREINNEIIVQYQLQLGNEILESVYTDNETNNRFNSFLCNFLNIFKLVFQSNIKIYKETRMARLYKE